MKKLFIMVWMLIIAIMLNCNGCASAPVIGPISYLAAKSNESTMLKASPSSGESVWSTVKMIVGYATDTFIYGTILNYAKNKLDAAGDKSGDVTINGDGNTYVSNSGDGTQVYKPSTDNSSSTGK